MIGTQIVTLKKFCTKIVNLNFFFYVYAPILRRSDSYVYKQTMVRLRGEMSK